ncbi:MAG: F0F1 ATP synthase subunit delta [Dysgonamonadaceae bacterium]|jgi:F-type H+-transporting ATPase subunit delta|nr:F0F1 ATP synthase subunit delta [Dysgonamonadaceae bacterium]
MDAGIIAHRYARAIYEFAAEKGKETGLYGEMQTLSKNFFDYPAMRNVMNDPTVEAAKKVELLTAAGGSSNNEILLQVIGLVVNNGRAAYMENIARMYETVYRKAKNQVVVHLTTVEPADEKLEKALIPVIAQATGNQVEFHTTTDADIIGGFILEIEDQRLDASVKNQLRIINYGL